MATRFYTVQQIPILNSAGSWNQVVASNKVTLNKTAAADTSVLYFEVPRDLHGSGLNSSGISNIKVAYSVATASLSSAPTVVVDEVSCDPTSGVTTRTAVTSTISFTGTNTVGTAAGTYQAVIPLDLGYNSSATGAFLSESDALVVELTFVAAATTVLKVLGVTVTYV